MFYRSGPATPGAPARGPEAETVKVEIDHRSGVPVSYTHLQRLEWVDPANAASVGDLLPATLPPLRWLQLPTAYGISSIGSRAGLSAFLGRLDAALARGVRLVQLREPQWPDGPASASLHEARCV